VENATSFVSDVSVARLLGFLQADDGVEFHERMYE
jgi:hypothetical protein